MGMKTKIYVNNEKFITGTTLQDSTNYENNNMALHQCENPEQIIENRKQLAQFLEIGLEDFVCAKQTHSVNFHNVIEADRGRGAFSQDTAIPETDALYTFEPNIMLSCFTADCVPVIFYNEISGVVGVIHSGWKGTVNEITLRVFQHLVEAEKCDPEDFFVWLGPALSQEKFEVDVDVFEKFDALGYAREFILYREMTKKYHIDNQKTVKKQCELAGIPSKQISMDRTCTFLSEEGFSYREDRRAGRHLSFVMKKKVEE